MRILLAPTSPLQRVVIIGATGAGKTTLARALSQKLASPVVELDELYWLPKWTARPLYEFKAMIDRELASQRWIVTGNDSQCRTLIWQKADTILWLDYPLFLLFARVVRRSVRRILDHETVCNGNHESWAKLLSKDSILLWLAKSFRPKRREYTKLFATKAPSLSMIRLRSPRETRLFLESMP